MKINSIVGKSITGHVLFGRRETFNTIASIIEVQENVINTAKTIGTTATFDSAHINGLLTKGFEKVNEHL